MGTLREDGMSSSSGRSYSDPEYTSSSEQSCDTVIYVGRNGQSLSDRDLTDNEAPPAMVPLLPPSSTPPHPAVRGPIPQSGDNVASPRPDTRLPKPRCGIGARLPPRSPVKTLPAVGKVHSSSSSPGPAVVQLPRKLHSKHKPSVSRSYNEEGAGGSRVGELWVDGPSAMQQAVPARVPPGYPGDQWIHGADSAGVPPCSQTSAKHTEQWVDQSPSHRPNTTDNGEQWVDGPSAFRLENQNLQEVSDSGAHHHHTRHKMWKEMKLKGHPDPASHSKSAESTPKIARKQVTPPKAPASGEAAGQPLRNPQLSSVARETRPVSQGSGDSNTSLAVNAESRPVSNHGDDIATGDTNASREELCPETAETPPVNSFVRAWVERHGLVSAQEREDKYKHHHHKGHSNSLTRTDRQRSPLSQITQDDMALRRNSHSPDRYVNSAQSSPRLRRIRKHTPPVQPNPGLDRTRAWLQSLEESATTPKLHELQCSEPAPNSPKLGSGNQGVEGSIAVAMETAQPAEEMECDQDILRNSNPPPDYDSCLEESATESNPGDGERQEGVGDILPQSQASNTEAMDVEDTRTGSSDRNSASRQGSTDNLMSANSLYELEMDATLETVRSDGSRKMTFSSGDDMSAWSSGSYQNINCGKQGDSMADLSRSSIDLEESAKKISTLTVESTPQENGSVPMVSGHLSPPSSDDSDKLPGSKLGRPTCLRCPDGASNPNLSLLEPQHDSEPLVLHLSAAVSEECKPCPRSGSSCDRVVDGKSPDAINPPESVPQSNSSSSRLPIKSKIGKTSKHQTELKSVPEVPICSVEKPPLPARPPSRLVSPSKSARPENVTSSSPSKSPAASPKSSPFRFPGSRDKGSKSATSSRNSSPTGSGLGILSFRSSSSKSKSSKLSLSRENSVEKVGKGRSQSSPAKTSSSPNEKDAHKAGRSSSKSPGPARKEKESRLPKMSFMSSRSRHTDSDSGNDSGIVKNDKKFLSPYSKLTKPRFSLHSTSSGHGSDISSTFSVPASSSSKTAPSLGKMAEASSGYESMMRDSEMTETSSSTSESSTSGHRAGNKGSKKKGKSSHACTFTYSVTLETLHLVLKSVPLC